MNGSAIDDEAAQTNEPPRFIFVCDPELTARPAELLMIRAAEWLERNGAITIAYLADDIDAPGRLEWLRSELETADAGVHMVATGRPEDVMRLAEQAPLLLRDRVRHMTILAGWRATETCRDRARDKFEAALLPRLKAPDGPNTSVIEAGTAFDHMVPATTFDELQRWSSDVLSNSFAVWMAAQAQLVWRHVCAHRAGKRTPNSTTREMAWFLEHWIAPEHRAHVAMLGRDDLILSFVRGVPVDAMLALIAALGVADGSPAESGEQRIVELLYRGLLDLSADTRREAVRRIATEEADALIERLQGTVSSLPADEWMELVLTMPWGPAVTVTDDCAEVIITYQRTVRGRPAAQLREDLGRRLDSVLGISPKVTVGPQTHSQSD